MPRIVFKDGKVFMFRERKNILNGLAKRNVDIKDVSEEIVLPMTEEVITLHSGVEYFSRFFPVFHNELPVDADGIELIGLVYKIVEIKKDGNE